jgi:hypothetical protein
MFLIEKYFYKNIVIVTMVIYPEQKWGHLGMTVAWYEIDIVQKGMGAGMDTSACFNFR